MKLHMTIGLAAIGLLTLAAFKPGQFVRFAEQVRYHMVERPINQLEFRTMEKEALAGDPESLYELGSVYFRGHGYFGSTLVIDRPEPIKGERMIRDAASLGHPDAIFWTWRQDGSDFDSLADVLATGSRMAEVHVFIETQKAPCDKTWDPFINQLIDLRKTSNIVVDGVVRDDLKRSNMESLNAHVDSLERIRASSECQVD